MRGAGLCGQPAAQGRGLWLGEEQLSTPSSQVLRGAVDGVAVQVSLVVARTPDGTVVTVGVDPAP